MNAWFGRVGFPQYVYLDNGPQFVAAEFKDYCAANFIRTLNSSACFPKSNCLAEAVDKKEREVFVAKIGQLKRF
jgi:hypothetical protein